jgi:hypothetical protein
VKVELQLYETETGPLPRMDLAGVGRFHSDFTLALP